MTQHSAAVGVPIVVICGSTRFMPEMAEANLQETADGKIVLAPGCNMKEPHPRWADPLEAERLKGRLDQLHRAKIRLADEVLVVGDYVGSSTVAEIRYARALGKPVRFTHPDVDHRCVNCDGVNPRKCLYNPARIA
jgi:nucleoside 2-deoxyribosyltransferase